MLFKHSRRGRPLPSPQACSNQRVVMLMISVFLLCTLTATHHVDAFRQRHDAMIPTRLAFPYLLRSSPRQTKSIYGATCKCSTLRSIATSRQLASKWIGIDWSNVDISAPIQDVHVHATGDESSDAQQYEVATYSDLIPTPSPRKPSPVECIMVRDRIVYVKRDDLLRLDRSGVSGNKARKFLALNELSSTDFPDVVVSYGGPQSNAMVALAAIVSSKNVSDDKDESKSLPEKGMGKEKRKRFVYYTKKLPRWLRNQPSGNFLRATSLGMELVELSPARYTELFGGENGGSSKPPLEPPASEKNGGDADTRCLWVPQGGACGVARPGARVLAEEIIAFWQKNGKGLPLAICLPGGTCSTALLLDREIKKIQQRRQQDEKEPLNIIKVVVVPCVGDDEYAKRQMSGLDISIGGGGLDLPAILKPMQQIKSSDHRASSGETTRKSKGYFAFGTPDGAILQTYIEMKTENGLFLDLLYGAPAWNIMLQHWSSSTYILPSKTFQNEGDYPISGRQIMYIHSGGLEGIASQMTRYKHQGLVDPANVQ